MNNLESTSIDLDEGEYKALDKRNRIVSYLEYIQPYFEEHDQCCQMLQQTQQETDQHVCDLQSKIQAVHGSMTAVQYMRNVIKQNARNTSWNTISSIGTKLSFFGIHVQLLPSLTMKEMLLILVGGIDWSMAFMRAIATLQFITPEVLWCTLVLAWFWFVKVRGIFGRLLQVSMWLLMLQIPMFFIMLVNVLSFPAGLLFIIISAGIAWGMVALYKTIVAHRCSAVQQTLLASELTYRDQLVQLEMELSQYIDAMAAKIQQLHQMVQEAQERLKTVDLRFYPASEEYHHAEILNEITKLIKNQRADTIQSAVNMLETDEYRHEHLNLLKEQTSYLKNLDSNVAKEVDKLQVIAENSRVQVEELHNVTVAVNENTTATQENTKAVNKNSKAVNKNTKAVNKNTTATQENTKALHANTASNYAAAAASAENAHETAELNRTLQSL